MIYFCLSLFFQKVVPSHVFTFYLTSLPPYTFTRPSRTRPLSSFSFIDLAGEDAEEDNERVEDNDCEDYDGEDVEEGKILKNHRRGE